MVRQSPSHADVAQLFEVHAGEIRGYLYRRAGQSGADLVGEVFAVALRRARDLPEPELRRAWLFATARRVLLAAERADRRRRIAEQEHSRIRDAAAAEASTWQGPSRTEAVREAIASLGEKDRELIRLTEWEGLQVAEAAAVLGMRAGTARVRLHRARRALADHPALRTLAGPSPGLSGAPAGSAPLVIRS